MIKWYKAQTRQVKIMAIFIILLVIGIITRWEYIREKAGDAFRNRLSPSQTEQAEAD